MANRFNGLTDYSELYNRNWPILSKSIQDKLSQLKIAVAGCGSTGGAFIEGALRAGVQNFHLCDNGTYELSNLNRQFVTQAEIGLNKATAYERKILTVNSQAKVKVWEQGLTSENLEIFLEGIDFVFDSVDVTTAAGMEMKLLLHEKAALKKIPTGSALDLGFTQWLQSYNYQSGDLALHGRLMAARSARSPLKALLLGFSDVEEMPLEIANEVLRLVKTPQASACQLASVCFLLAGMVTPYMVHFVNKRRLPPLIAIDLIQYFEDADERKLRERQTKECHIELRRVLSSLP